MLYFDMRPALTRLSADEQGKLLMAMFDYAELGVVPELDGMVGLCFDMIKPKLDRDADKYEYQKLHGRYMAYCRETAEADRMSEEEFIKKLSATDSY